MIDYKDALKQIQTAKKTSRENFLVFRFDYDHKFILPYKDGVALMASLANAERYVDTYGDAVSRITPVDDEAVRISQMSAEMYDRIKTAALLNIPIRKLLDAIESTQKEAEARAKEESA